MRLTTTLAATGGVALIGALTLGAALPAAAAPTVSSADHTEYAGPFVLSNTVTGGRWWMAITIQGNVLQNNDTRSKPEAIRNAVSVIVPASGTQGQVKIQGRCLATTTATDAQARLADCSDASSTQVRIGVDGSIYDPSGRVLDVYDDRVAWQRTPISGPTYREFLNYDILAPVAPIVDPTAKVISADPVDKSGVIGGTGEPGATIEVTDPTGKAHPTTVDKDGNWQIKVPGLKFGDNAIPVRQIVEGFDDKSTSVTIPLAPADLSADVKSTNKDDKTAVVGGKGQPGADITVTAPDGTPQTVKVDADGNWIATVENLKTGANPIKVEQAVEGAAPQTKDLVATIGAADLSAEVISTDADKATAVVGGKGEPGAELIVTGPEGPQAVVVDNDGNWSVTVPGMKEGDNPVKVEQKVGDDTQTEDLVVTLLPSPIANPAIAGGAAIAALAALGTVLLRRRKLQQQ